MDKTYVVLQSREYHQYKTLDEAIIVAKKETNRSRTKGYDYDFGVYGLVGAAVSPVPAIDFVTVAG